jgi:hypothetical protein
MKCMFLRNIKHNKKCVIAQNKLFSIGEKRKKIPLLNPNYTDTFIYIMLLYTIDIVSKGNIYLLRNDKIVYLSKFKHLIMNTYVMLDWRVFFFVTYIDKYYDH